MNYEKLSPEKFTEKLKGKEYQDLTGARRAIGKASWAEAAKATARAQAEKFFGVPGNVKAAAASKKAPTKQAKKEGAKTNSKLKQTKLIKQKRAPKGVSGSTEDQIVAGIGGGISTTKPLTMADVRKNPFQVIQLAEHCVASGTSVLNAATEMKKQDATVDVAGLTEEAVKTIRGGLDLATKVITSLASGIEGQQEATASSPVNGVAHIAEPAAPGDPIYTAPTAEA